jgi:sugar/nucleoside kinase (ribokinase family)
MRTCVTRVKDNGATVSFDPNVRKELLAADETRRFFDWMIDRTDIFLPSGEEIFMFASGNDVADAAAKLIARGVGEVVVKMGERGATAFTAERTHDIAGLKVDEIDPTGAGDCFGATYVTCRLLGKSLEDSLLYANAAGGRQVTWRGPMEGTSSFAELDALLANASRQETR